MERGHSDWIDILFYLGLSLLVCHELDAVTKHEWRLLPILNLLPDASAQIAFVIAHIPLFAGIFWLVDHRSFVVRRRSRMAVDGFLVVHAVIHFLLSDHELYEFEAPLEGLLVYGGAIVGLSHLFAVQAKPSA